MSILPQRIDVMYLSLSVPTFRFFFFFWGGGGGADRQAGGEDLIDRASPVVPVLSVSTCTTCLRVGMFYCGLESYKQTNHMLAITIMLLITILTSVFLLSVLKS